jgi:hypothetical protein
MPTIPQSNFGFAAPGPGIQPNVTPAAGTIAQAGEQLGNTVQRVGADLGAQEREQMLQTQRARAALTLAQVGNDMHDAHDEVARGVLDGSIPTAQASQAFADRTAKIRENRLQGLTELQRQQIDANIEATSGALNRNLNGVVIKRQQSETGGFIDQFGEQVQREGVRNADPKWAAEKFGAMVDFTGQAAGLTPEEMAKKKQAFSENVHLAFFDNAATAALGGWDKDAIHQLRTDLQGPMGEAIDPIKRASLDHRLISYMDHIDAAQERLASKGMRELEHREKKAGDEVQKAIDLTTSGQYLSPDYVRSLQDLTAGTSYEGAANWLVSTQKEVAGFATRPADQRDATVNTLRARAADPAQGTNPNLHKITNSLEKINESAKREAADNPWVAAQKYGVIQDAGAISVAKPGDIIPIIQGRMAQIGQVESWTGKKISPLQPQEAEQLGKIVRTLPADQAASLLASIGQVMGDRDRVAAVAKQIGDKDGTLGLAMSYANAQTTQGRVTSELILRGEQAIRDKTVNPDGAKESGWRADIATQIRGAYSNREIEDQAINAAFLIMAARNADHTQSDATTANAVRLATGGVIERNGAKIPLPYGMDEGAFNDKLKSLKPESFASQAPSGFVRAGNARMPLDQFLQGLPDAQLVHAGQGVYNVRAGSTLVTTDAGRRLFIKVTP